MRSICNSRGTIPCYQNILAFYDKEITQRRRYEKKKYIEVLKEIPNKKIRGLNKDNTHITWISKMSLER